MVAYNPSPDFDVLSLNVARPIAVARRALPWLVGPAVFLVRGSSLELADASACPGLLELISIGVVRSRPDLPVGELFVGLQVVVMAAALAAFIALACRYTRLWSAIAAATAVAFGPLFPSVVAPPWEAAAFGIAAIAALGVATSVDCRRSSRSAIRSLAVAAACAGLVLVPMWLLARSLSTGPVSACVTPTGSAARAIEMFATAASWLGPFAMGLAALGAFTAIRSARRRELLMVTTAAIVMMVAASTTALSSPVVAAPLAVLLWSLAGIGLEQIVDATGTTLPAPIATVLIVVLLPALAASRRVNQERDDWIRPRGHEQQTLRRITTVLNLVPAEAAFVVEDATVDVLLRAAVFGGRRQTKPITIVGADPEIVGRALTTHAVYAFPRRQEDLALRGFVVDATAAARSSSGSGASLDGVARITGRRSCQRVGPTWADFDGEDERFALSADSEEARGPAVIYFGGESPGTPQPDGWSMRMLRGFGYLRLDRLTPAGVERMRAEARAASVPETHPVFTKPFVLRFNLHRTPRAPLALPVKLGARFPLALVKLDEHALDVGRLMICDAPATAASALPRPN